MTTPDDERFKEYSVHGHAASCDDVSKLPKKVRELVVFNPVTEKSKALPPLLHSRNSVVVHISVNCARRSYKVIVPGSSTASDEYLSKKMEVFDSSTSAWKEACDLPGPAFGLNEHQAGLCLMRRALSEGSFIAINYFIKNKVWECSGFDLHSKSWRSLPTFSFLPATDAEIFKEYSVHGHGGLMCAEVSKLPKKAELGVFNPVTGKSKALPPLLHPRNPVLVHISVDRSYKVIVPGSSTASDEHLLFKMKVFDSSTPAWKEACDLPGPAFGLEEYQAGKCLMRRSLSEGSFTAINYYIKTSTKNKVWQFREFDLHSKSWRALPHFSYLPTPDAELFKEYSLSGHGGPMCADVSKLPKKGELVVFNPLTRKKTSLPPLLYPRNPELVHISVDSAQKSYIVIVAGSSTASDEHLSRKMEIFDSSTSKWKETSDLPGPAFGLNEHQAGVCLDGKLFFISFLEGDCRRGLVAFDVEQEKWLEKLECPIPFSSYSNTSQLVQSDGKVYLFSEQERGQSVEHCIDVLEFRSSETGAMAWQWRTVVRVRKSGGRGLLVYPELTCVGFGEGKLLIFNALKRDGVVYDMRDGRQCEVLDFLRASRLRFSVVRQVMLSYFVKLLLFVFLLASTLIGAGAEDQSGKLNPTIVWDIRDYAKTAVVTMLLAVLLVGLMKFIARVAGGINHQLQGPPALGNVFDVAEGLEKSVIPTKCNKVFEILPEIS